MKATSQSGDRLTDWVNLSVIIVFCGILAYLRWLKMETLLWGDTPRWLFEAQRVAVGEVPYRDFAWNYPPFSVLLLGWSMRWFGVKFSVAQVFVDIISLAVVLATYSVVRLLFPRFLIIPVMFCLIAVCGTSLGFFNLFSLLTYVPALQTGVAGFLLFLIGVMAYLRTGEITPTTWVSVTVGAFVAAFSKPETFIAVYSTLMILALADRSYWFLSRPKRLWCLHYAKLAVACALPALLAYLATIMIAGSANMFAGITGYGLATATCPWWPTGLGVFGAISALGEGAFILAAFWLVRREYFLSRFGRLYYGGLILAILGGCVYSAYVASNNWDLLTGSRSLVAKIWNSGQTTFWTSAVLLPVMWSSVILWICLILRFFFRGKKLSHDVVTMTVLLTGPVAMSARGWFNWNLGLRSDVPGVCYPFFLVLGPLLIWRFLSLGAVSLDLDGAWRSRAGIAVTTLLITYGALRIVASYPNLLSNRMFADLSTQAGDVRVADYKTDLEIYQFVMENTTQDDTVLDLPYGGGINFAAHRLSPLFETQFQQLRMPERILEKDLLRLEQHQPKVVIAENQAGYGVSYGLDTNACAFPQLVWARSIDVNVRRVFPAIASIEKNYRVARIIGRKLLLVPR